MTLRVLERFIEHPTAWRYGYELSRETGLKSGTLYPILMRLAKFSLLETKCVTTEDGVPPRHTYRLTPKGGELVRSPARSNFRSSKSPSPRLQRRPRMMPVAYPRRIAALLLRFAIWMAPHDTLDWGRGMLGELNHVQGNWAVFRRRFCDRR